MSDIIKTWPANAHDARTVIEIFRPRTPYHETFFFTLGKGKPRVRPERIWMTCRGRILGSIAIETIVQNDGTFPQLYRLDNVEQDWHIKRDAWVAICVGSFTPLRERLYMDGFRGWRYFDLEKYRQTPGLGVRS